MPDRRSFGVVAVVLFGAIIAGAVGVLLFGAVPEYTPLGTWQVVLSLFILLGGAYLARKWATSVFPGYNVAEVAVEGPISQSGDGGPIPTPGSGASAEEITEQIERADEDDDVEALVLNMNTPGGEVVASEDIRHAVDQFEGPTVAYATNLCASGGMWIASGCDEVHAREGSRIGSIGVLGPSFGTQNLLDKVGVEYRRFVAGDFKDSPSPFRDLRDEEVEYVQGLLDDWYEQFVETVVEGRQMDEETIRDTEARIYLGAEAKEIGLVDSLGSRNEMEGNLADELHIDEVEIEQFEPEHGLGDRLSIGASRLAYSLGVGIASVVTPDQYPKIRM